MEKGKPMMTKEVNGKKVYFVEVLPTTTTVKFTLRQRIKILFGFKVQVTTKHYFRYQSYVVAVEASTILLSTAKILKRNLVKPPDIDLKKPKENGLKKA